MVLNFYTSGVALCDANWVKIFLPIHESVIWDDDVFLELNVSNLVFWCVTEGR
jgi:hypothetical protein